MPIDLIARDAELGVVEAFLDRPGTGARALVLEGPAGIGKTALWSAGVAAARQRMLHVLVSRPAESERSFANVVLGDLFGEIPHDLVTTMPRPRRRAFESALFQGDRDETDVDPRALATAVLTLLTSLAAQDSVLLAIDDDQWIDPSSLGALRFAVRRLPNAPIRLLLARRVESGSTAVAPSSQFLDASIEPESVEHLPLGPLTIGAIQLLLRTRLDVTLSRPNLLRLADASGGNAFFALELARAQPPAGASGPLVVPPSLERLLVGRLDAIAGETARALLMIAAHGRTPLDVLQRSHVEMTALDRAITEQLVESSDGVVRFTHPLLASAVYQRATAEARRAAHLELAAALDDPVGRAHHLALGTTDPSAEVSGAIEAASVLADGRGSPIAAAELAEHAARLTPRDAIDDRHRRMLAAGRARLRGGDAEGTLAIAAELLTQSPSARRRAEALMLQAELEPPGLAVPLLEEALALTAGNGDLEAAIHARIAVEGRFVRGDAWAERHGEALLQLAERQDDAVLRTTALVTVALLEFDRADVRALPRAEEALRLANSVGDRATLKLATLAVGHILAWSGMTVQAREWLERQIGEWRDRDEHAHAELIWCLALVEVAAGRWAAAAQYAEQAEDGNAEPGPGSHFLPALVALHRGQFSVAREQSRLGLQPPEREFLEDFEAILAICDAWTGSLDDAVRHFEQAERVSDARGWHASLRYWRPEHIETLVRLGRVDEADRLLDDWQAVAPERARVHAQAMRCRGLIAGARGDPATAMSLLEQAADREAAADDPFGRARALLAIGVVRRRTRQRSGARETLETAVEAFQALGAESWVATARSELSRIGGRRRVIGLSESEARVARLVAEGRTNREIAAALFLTERTVASHLTHVYAKLGIRSRSELAAHAALRQQTSADEPGKVPMS